MTPPDLRLTTPTPGQFRIEPAPNYFMTADEQAFAATVAAAVPAIAAHTLAVRTDADPALAARHADARTATLAQLRTIAERILAAPAGPGRDRAARDAMAECWRTEGRFTERMRQLDQAPFRVDLAPRPGHPALHDNLHITTRDTAVPPAAARLKTEIHAATTLARTVLNERERAAHAAEWWMGRAEPIHTAQLRLDDAMRQLHAIATAGLTNTDPTHAAAAHAGLVRFRDDFLAREGGAARNRYVWRLGLVCLVTAALALAGYVAIRMHPHWQTAYIFRNFLLLACGTAIGTWLSFSLRRIRLTFDDLAVLEDDRLDPALRVVFMVALVSAAGLLLSSGVISVGIGAVTGHAALLEHGSQALLLGLLSGSAERALGTAILPGQRPPR